MSSSPTICRWVVLEAVANRGGPALTYSTVQYSTVQWRAGADLALEHAAGVGRHVVEDDVGGRGVAEHLYSTVQYSTVQYSTV